jgi:hypothetical protein
LFHGKPLSAHPAQIANSRRTSGLGWCKGAAGHQGTFRPDQAY